MLSNSEDEGQGENTEGKHKTKMRTKRDRKGSSPTKMLDVGESLNSQHFQTMNLTNAL
jgi:hypothetical protein